VTPAVTAAVLVIGDEILSGRTQDTNLGAIARFLAVRGIDLAEGRVVADRTEDIVAALNALRARYDYVFTTGGIGPTHDDITAEAVARAFGVPLLDDPRALAILSDRYAGELNTARRRMARIPQGGDLIANPVSHAPGFQVGNVFVLAGVPPIMIGMLEDVGHRLQGGVPVVSRTVRVEGSGEGVLAEPLERVARARPALSLGSYPFFNERRFGSNLVVRGRDHAEVDAAVAELIEALAALGVEGRVEDGQGTPY
jgi:molybdenum cofactor synthesis domain-containing protein